MKERESRKSNNYNLILKNIKMTAKEKRECM